MKNKIITFIIGALRGTIITSAWFLIFKPNSSKKIQNIEVSSYNVLSDTFWIEESKMNNIYIGKDVKIKVKALNNREIDGIITDIFNTASNGRFNITI